MIGNLKAIVANNISNGPLNDKGVSRTGVGQLSLPSSLIKITLTHFLVFYLNFVFKLFK